MNILYYERNIGRCTLGKNRKVCLVVGFTDIRKQINGLAQIAESKKAKELLSWNYFVLLGKTRRFMKIFNGDNTSCFGRVEGGNHRKKLTSLLVSA